LVPAAEMVASEPEPAMAPAGVAEAAWAAADSGDDEEYDFLSDSEAEAHQTRLDLAQAYIDMKEAEPARELLLMVQQGGTAEQRRLAGELLRSLA
ncbi:MAG: FimV/HubP family polar landmark protein, partial [Perlucidibaca sp.]